MSQRLAHSEVALYLDIGPCGGRVDARVKRHVSALSKFCIISVVILVGGGLDLQVCSLPNFSFISLLHVLTKGESGRLNTMTQISDVLDLFG